MARQTFHPPGGGVGWVDDSGRAYLPGVGVIGVTPGTTPEQLMAANLRGVVGELRDSRSTTTVAGAGASSGTALTAAQSAQGAQWQSILDQYDLGDLASQIDGWLRQGLTWDQVWLQLMDPSTEAGKVVDRIYPELRLRREKGLRSSIAEIRSYHEQGAQLLRGAGLDRVLDVRSFLRDRYVDNVSLQQVNQRVADMEDEIRRAVSSDPDALAELDFYQRKTGVTLTSKDLLAFAFDFDKADAEIRRTVRAARLDVQAGRAGFGDLSVAEGERLADLGVSEQGAAQGFAFLSDAQDLFDPLVGTSEDQIGREEQFAAVFEGNANARRRIARRGRQRTAEFERGGGFERDQGGYSGLGAAR